MGGIPVSNCLGGMVLGAGSRNHGIDEVIQMGCLALKCRAADLRHFHRILQPGELRLGLRELVGRDALYLWSLLHLHSDCILDLSLTFQRGDLMNKCQDHLKSLLVRTW